MSDGDVEELVEGYREELTAEELQELEKEEHKTRMDALSSGSEEEEMGSSYLIYQGNLS